MTINGKEFKIRLEAGPEYNECELVNTEDRTLVVRGYSYGNEGLGKALERAVEAAKGK
jgi:hypothetical protein